MMFKIGWFSTGRDQAAIDLFEIVQNSIATGEILAEISFCFSNRVPGETPESDAFFKAIVSRDIPLVHFSSKDFSKDMWEKGKTDPKTREEWRGRFDREVIRRIEEYQNDIIVLAGYMLIAGQGLCRKFRMINLHPALPGGPVGTWQQVIQQLIDDGAEETGAMMHLVTPDLDRGPSISYYTFGIQGGVFKSLWDREDKQTLFNEIRRKGVERELPLILLTLKEFAYGNLAIEAERVYSKGKLLEKGYDLTERIEEWLEK